MSRVIKPETKSGPPSGCGQQKKMKTPHSTLYRFTAETITEANKLKIGTVSEHAHKQGMLEGDALIMAMDALIKYAEAYRIRFDAPLADDYILGKSWLTAATSLREMLNGDAELAMRRNITTDTKDNGCCEGMFWAGMRHAGFEEKDI